MPLSHGYADGNFRVIGLADMARAIRLGREHRCGGALAFHVLEVMEAFQRSSDEGRTVAIESRCDRPAPAARAFGVGRRWIDDLRRMGEHKRYPSICEDDG